MNNRRPLSDGMRARLRKLGNPYASLQLSDEDEGAIIHPSKSPQELTLELTQNPWATQHSNYQRDSWWRPPYRQRRARAAVPLSM